MSEELDERVNHLWNELGWRGSIEASEVVLRPEAALLIRNRLARVVKGDLRPSTFEEQFNDQFRRYQRSVVDECDRPECVATRERLAQAETRRTLGGIPPVPDPDWEPGTLPPPESATTGPR